ncbi:hypothetical protein [Thioclava sp. IC9]|uniref:hypothetical protein n=1 Tax=Thioclava sp. IC9 TaxID=1973007 RepID=UPI00112FDC88|nr:hypothetical protein [Thioclava sp. IC9]
MNTRTSIVPTIHTPKGQDDGGAGAQVTADKAGQRDHDADGADEPDQLMSFLAKAHRSAPVLMLCRAVRSGPYAFF